MSAQKSISLFFLSFFSFACLANEPTSTVTSSSQSTLESVQQKEKRPFVGNNNDPISIDADNQQIDIEKNMITFSGNVVVVQDGLTILSDKVVITDMQDPAKQKVTAYGNPIKFNRVMPEKDKNISGHSDQLVYNVKQNLVTLIGHAEVVQQDSHINSSLITYDVSKQLILAKPGKNERVKTTIIPNQFKKDK